MNDGAQVVERRPSAWLAPSLFFALAFPTLATWLYFIQFAGTGAVKVFYVVGKVVQFGFPVFYSARVERVPLRALLRPQVIQTARISRTQSLAMGAAVGLAVLALAIGGYSLLARHTGLFVGVPEAIRTKLSDAGAATPGRFLLLAVFYSLCHSLLEEYYWRWFVYGRLRQRLPVGAAVLISSLGFMAHHTLVIGLYFGGLSPMTMLLSAGVAMGGAIWAWLYEQSGELYGPWLSHLLVDAALMTIGYQMVWG